MQFSPEVRSFSKNLSFGKTSIKKAGVLLFLAILFLYGLLLCNNAGAEESQTFPSIEKLDARDTVFKQYLADVEAARLCLYGKNAGSRDVNEFLRIYVYTPKQDEDIFRLSARCNVPYSALATLNRAGHSDLPKEQILLPTVPGLFIPESPENDLERLISLSRNMDEGTIITVRNESRAVRFLFFPGADFNQTERSFFLNKGFRFPLRSYRISSSFGMRQSPFTGKLQIHNGVDLAAPIGTDVYSAREGKVTEMGTDSVLGNYIIIAHEDNWASLYGHLSSFSVKLDNAVTAGTIIGKVGTTGQSTGPHLHFELRKSGAALDPAKILFRN